MTYMSVNEAAQLIGCHPQTIRRAIHDGRLLAFKLNPDSPRGRYKIRPQDLQQWVTAGRVTRRPVPTPSKDRVGQEG